MNFAFFIFDSPGILSKILFAKAKESGGLFRIHRFSFFIYAEGTSQADMFTCQFGAAREPELSRKA